MGGQCSLCHPEVKANANPERILTCGRCTQILLAASRENKNAFREMLIAKGDLEAARSVESFISPEQEVINEPSRNFRRIMVGTRLSRKVRITHRHGRPLPRHQPLDQGRSRPH